MYKPIVHIVKIGGNVINDSDQLQAFLIDFAKIEGHKILVHGGGKKATELSNRLGLSPEMKNGRRITDIDSLEIVTMVYSGLINKNIVSQLQQHNCNAIGLSGADGNSIRAHKRIIKDIDYGYAGDIDEVNIDTIKIFLKNKLIPVFCAITHDKKGQLLNTNADTIASEIAAALSEYYQTILIYCFEKNGVLRDVNNDESLIEKIDSKNYEILKNDHVIADGMLPKLENCFYALKHGVSKIVIGNPSIISSKEQKCTILTL